jgi:transcriptional regulator with XRE-family HTH domain
VEKIYDSLVNEAFGLRLSRMRRERRVSQSELGRRIGRSRATIANLENGNQGVLLQYVYAIAVALDADVIEFLPDIHEVRIERPAANDQGFLDMARHQLSSLLGELDDEKS